VAKSSGLPPQTVDKVTLHVEPDSTIVQVKAEVADQDLAAKLANAVATALSEDFKNNPDFKVRVLSVARHGRSGEKRREK